MKKIFLDTDVIIDFLIDRRPFSESAAQIFSLAESGEIEAFVSTLCFNNIYYITRRLADSKTAVELLRKLTLITTVLPVDQMVLKQALSSNFKDFEDAIQNFCAKQEKEISVLITRNIKEYQKSDLAIHTPDSYLKIIRKS
jgi:predicted nucleic acid-binding protein